MTKSKKISKTACTTRKKKSHLDSIWNNNTTEERQKIREFWIQLEGEERRSLVKLEKEAVLRKIKEQQKHSCGCLTCNKRRVAIKDELEELYDAYYEELEQYAAAQQKKNSISSNKSNYTTPIDSSTQNSLPLSLAIQGDVPTTTESLLENNSQYFLDMMEHFAEGKIKNGNIGQINTGSGNQRCGKEDTQTEEQRKEKGRQMLEVFAARRFEQRILATYKEKIAQERQKKLLEELEEEERLREERETKKQLEKEKKKSKKRYRTDNGNSLLIYIKRQLRKQQEEQQVALESKRKVEGERIRKQREWKLEEERKRLEIERLKREEEKRRREEEWLKKEEERKRKQSEERKVEEKKAEKRQIGEKRSDSKKNEKRRIETKKVKERKDEENVRKERKEEENDEKERKKKAETTIGHKPILAESPIIENRQQLLMDALVGTSSPYQLPSKPSLFSAPYLHYPYTTTTTTTLSHPSTSPYMPASRQLTSPSFLYHPPSPYPELFHRPTPALPEKPNRRPIASIAPIGQPITPPSPHSPDQQRVKGSTPSFFSNFLFGEPQSVNRSEPNNPQGPEKRLQKNEWSAFSLLSENVHGRLFGDALPDRTCVLLERAKAAYRKLAASKTHGYHTLAQLHSIMMNDLYLPTDLRELHQVLCSSSEFKCVPFGQDVIVYFGASPHSSPLLLYNEFTHAN
ncbi:salt tolerance down-regulator-domain-containing protein [Sporodiniella umbellata]|nr:salt tolerance down-regulator-domain-containing protein [Sporodiniella umbellata]